MCPALLSMSVFGSCPLQACLVKLSLASPSLSLPSHNGLVWFHVSTKPGQQLHVFGCLICTTYNYLFSVLVSSPPLRPSVFSSSLAMGLRRNGDCSARDPSPCPGPRRNGDPSPCQGLRPSCLAAASLVGPGAPRGGDDIRPPPRRLANTLAPAPAASAAIVARRALPLRRPPTRRGIHLLLGADADELRPTATGLASSSGAALFTSASSGLSFAAASTSAAAMDLRVAALPLRRPPARGGLDHRGPLPAPIALVGVLRRDEASTSSLVPTRMSSG
jgi:hypothetical protein